MAHFCEATFRNTSPCQTQWIKNPYPLINTHGISRREVRSVSPPIQISSLTPLQVTHHIPQYTFPFQIINTIVLPNEKNNQQICQRKWNNVKQNIPESNVVDESPKKMNKMNTNYLSEMKLIRVQSQSGKNFRNPVNRQNLNQCSQNHQYNSFHKKKYNNFDEGIKNQKPKNKMRFLVQCCTDCYENLYKIQSSKISKQSLREEKSVWCKEREIIQSKDQQNQKKRKQQELQDKIIRVVQRKMRDTIKQNKLSQLQTNQKSISAQQNDNFFNIRKRNYQNVGKQLKHRPQGSEEVHVNKFLTTQNYSQTANYPVTSPNDPLLYQSQLIVLESCLEKDDYLTQSRKKVRDLEQKINALKIENYKLWNSMK